MFTMCSVENIAMGEMLMSLYLWKVAEASIGKGLYADEWGSASSRAAETTLQSLFLIKLTELICL